MACREGGGYEQEPVSIRGRGNGVEGECIARSKPVRGTELEHTSLLQLVIGNQGLCLCWCVQLLHGLPTCVQAVCTATRILCSGTSSPRLSAMAYVSLQ